MTSRAPPTPAVTLLRLAVPDVRPNYLPDALLPEALDLTGPYSRSQRHIHWAANASDMFCGQRRYPRCRRILSELMAEAQ